MCSGSGKALEAYSSVWLSHQIHLDFLSGDLDVLSWMKRNRMLCRAIPIPSVPSAFCLGSMAFWLSPMIMLAVVCTIQAFLNKVRNVLCYVFTSCQEVNPAVLRCKLGHYCTHTTCLAWVTLVDYCGIWKTWSYPREKIKSRACLLELLITGEPHVIVGGIRWEQRDFLVLQTDGAHTWWRGRRVETNGSDRRTWNSCAAQYGCISVTPWITHWKSERS